MQQNKYYCTEALSEIVNNPFEIRGLVSFSELNLESFKSGREMDFHRFLDIHVLAVVYSSGVCVWGLSSGVCFVCLFVSILISTEMYFSPAG